MTPPRDLGPSAMPLAAVLRHAAEVLEQSAADAPVSVQGNVVELLAGLGGRLDAELAVWAASFDAHTGWAADGARSAAGWLAARTELSRPHAGWAVAAGRDLRACPHVAAAWRAGRLGTAKVKFLLAARKAHPQIFAEHEADLVDTIAPLTVQHASVVMARWEQIARATKEYEDQLAGADTEPDAPPADPVLDNDLHLSRSLDGRTLGTVDLDPVSGAELQDAIAAEIDAMFHAGTAQADDGIPLGRRQAQALSQIVERGRRPGQTLHGAPRPAVSVTIDHQTLAGLPATSLLDGLSRRCELLVHGADSGIAIPPATAERLLCTARVTGLLTRIDADGAVETLGITDVLRDATRAQRRALKLRDGGCVFPGCTAPPDWCQAHHVVPANPIDGPTLLHNLVLVCSHHHHLIHEGGWRLWRHTDGQLWLARPDRSVVTLVRHGTKTVAHAPPNPPPVPPPLPPPVRFR